MPEYAGWLTPRAEVRSVGARGRGAIATDSIDVGEPVAAFGGVVYSGADLDAMPEWQRHLTMQIHEDLFITSPAPGDPADAINHSCDPNCGLQGEVTLVAMRPIAPGEELTFDYAMCDSAPFDEFPCSCGAEICRGVVRSDAWQLPELQARYGPYFSPYLAQRIARAHERSADGPGSGAMRR